LADKTFPRNATESGSDMMDGFIDCMINTDGHNNKEERTTQQLSKSKHEPRKEIVNPIPIFPHAKSITQSPSNQPLRIYPPCVQCFATLCVSPDALFMGS